MIYNLVESTVTNGIDEIYDKLNNKGASFTTVIKEIQEVWFSHSFHKYTIDMQVINHIKKNVCILHSSCR
jgi:hypothetical protein